MSCRLFEPGVIHRQHKSAIAFFQVHALGPRYNSVSEELDLTWTWDSRTSTDTTVLEERSLKALYGKSAMQQCVLKAHNGVVLP